MRNFDETRFLRIQSGAVGHVEAIENRTLSAKLWPREGCSITASRDPWTRSSQKGR